MDFSFPLFLRKERAKIQKTNLKIESNIYETNLRTLEIQNEINAVYAELENLQRMIVQQESAVQSYQALLNAEILNLELGESNIFQINFQQDKLIESQSKLLSLETKFEVSKVKLLWSAGVPYLNY
jgi:outer membrane protein TolC